MPRIRPRISLLTLLLLTAIAAMAIVIAQLWREVGPLRAEVRRLRSEVGYLTIEDPTKAYAISVPTFEENSWRWRIFLPPGRMYALNERSGRLPAPSQHPGDEWFDAVKRHGSGSSSSGSNLSGEFTLEAKLIKQDDRWLLVTQFTKSDGDSSTRSGGRTSIHPDEWLSEQRSRPTRSDVPAVDQKTFDRDAPILLLHRMEPLITETEGGFTSRTPEGPANGFVLWIEAQAPEPPAKPKANAAE